MPGADKAEVMPTDGHPVVLAKKSLILPNQLYWCMVIMMCSLPSHWNSGHSRPFEPVIKDGKIYARGSADDKGQFYMHVKALETMVKTNTMTTNIKFLIEGEEEVGSPNLGKFVAANKALIESRCDTDQR